MKTPLKAVTILSMLLPTLLFAHDGHGHLPGSHPLHYVAEPLHVVIGLVAVSAIGGLLYSMLRKKRKA